jgi:hypothetical protein
MTVKLQIGMNFHFSLTYKQEFEIDNERPVGAIVKGIYCGFLNERYYSSAFFERIPSQPSAFRMRAHFHNIHFGITAFWVVNT